jgi:hypothetical protein
MSTRKVQRPPPTRLAVGQASRGLSVSRWLARAADDRPRGTEKLLGSVGGLAFARLTCAMVQFERR